tara:strand:- start:33 stop:458 length:426 start_codon:yes stop_codon:yes gene_type:complete
MSQINVDTIRKSDGSLGTDIRVKNTSVYESDGGTSVTQNLVQGLAKAWCKFNGTSTLTVNDSFNISSVTDVGTGNYSPQINNNMVNEHFCAHATKRNESTNTGAQVQIPSYASGSNNIQMHESDSATDSSAVSYSVKGDLA